MWKQPTHLFKHCHSSRLTQIMHRNRIYAHNTFITWVTSADDIQHAQHMILHKWRSSKTTNIANHISIMVCQSEQSQLPVFEKAKCPPFDYSVVSVGLRVDVLEFPDLISAGATPRVVSITLGQIHIWN